MKLIFANNTSVLPGRSELWAGREKDVDRFQRKWIIPYAPKLEMEKGDPASEWSTVAKLLDGISWNLRMTLCVRNTTEITSQAANILIEANEGYRDLKKFWDLFQGLLVKMEIKIATGKARSVTFRAGDWHTSANRNRRSSQAYDYDVKLSVEEVVHLLMTNDNDIRISYVYQLSKKDTSAGAVCKKIWETGHFSDLEVVSKEGTVIPCHKVFFIEGSGEFKNKLEGGASSVKVNLSARVVRVLLGYLYHGELDQIKEDLELAMEVLEANGSYNVPNLWKEISGIFIGKDLDADAKVAFAVFSILVKAGKVDEFDNLSRKLVAVIHLNSGQVAGDSGAFMDFMDQAFVTALYKLVAIVVRVEGVPPPMKQARLHK